MGARVGGELVRKLGKDRPFVKMRSGLLFLFIEARAAKLRVHRCNLTDQLEALSSQPTPCTVPEPLTFTVFCVTSSPEPIRPARQLGESRQDTTA